MLASRVLLVLASLSGLLSQMAFADTASARLVMTWVPPYAVQGAQDQLSKLYNGAGPSNSLSHLGLQFWQPTSTGGLRREDFFGAISNAKVAEFVAWGDAHNVKTMLTVFNADPATGQWDWNLAKAGFATNRNRFINALVAEMQARNLDGIDVDLEGVVDATAEEKNAYLVFVRLLAARVHTLGKEITVDTFHYIWNAPNMTWWPQLFPYVDGITSMGYADLGRRGSPNWHSYVYQMRAARAYAHKLMIGMPSDVSAWDGNTEPENPVVEDDLTAATHLQWFLTAAAGDVGIGIWDAQFPAARWRTWAVWSRLKTVREDEISAGAAQARAR